MNDHKVASFKSVIAVSHDLAMILLAPDNALADMDGPFCQDNSFENIPVIPGVYLCSVDFYFYQGYYEGYKAYGESSWKYVITNSESLIALPNVTDSWIEEKVQQ